MIGGQVGTSDPTNRTYADRLERLIDELSVRTRICWTGYVPSSEVSAALLAADVVLLPYRDGISLRRGSLHAALAHGCAVVSTYPRVPLQGFVDGQNVLLVPPQDPLALARAANHLWRNLSLRRRLSEGAKALAQEFTWDRIARRTVEEVFAPLIQAHSTSGARLSR